MNNVHFYYYSLGDNKIIKIDEIIDEVQPDECCDLINRYLPTVTAGSQMMKTIYLK